MKSIYLFLILIGFLSSAHKIVSVRESDNFEAFLDEGMQGDSGDIELLFSLDSHDDKFRFIVGESIENGTKYNHYILPDEVFVCLDPKNENESRSLYTHVPMKALGGIYLIPNKSYGLGIRIMISVYPDILIPILRLSDDETNKSVEHEISFAVTIWALNNPGKLKQNLYAFV